MKAAIFTEIGQYPTVQESQNPEPRPHEALIRVEAAALNRRDEWIRVGMYPNISLPVVLGSDVCGIVERCSAKPQLVGKRVVLCPSLDWGSSQNYQSNGYTILGMPSAGGFAEYICHDADLLVEAPDHLSAEQSAAFSLAGLTAWRALVTQGCFQAGARVLVTGGGGGVASLAVTFAIALGAETWVTSGRDDIVESAKMAGAAGGANYGGSEWWKSLPRNFDVIIDGAGGPDFGRLIRLLGMGGHLVFYGGTNGKWPEISPQHLFFKQAKIVGSTMGSPEEFVAMFKCVSEHRLVPTIDSQWALADIAAAMQRLVSPQRQGKVVVKVN